MTRDDIIRMARSAGCHDNGEEFRFVEFRYLERFAALVATSEREACETIADAEASSWGGFDSGFTASVNIAAAIRARGNT